MQALRSRRQVILDNVRDNDEAGASYAKVGSLIILLNVAINIQLTKCMGLVSGY